MCCDVKCIKKNEQFTKNRQILKINEQSYFHKYCTHSHSYSLSTHIHTYLKRWFLLNFSLFFCSLSCVYLYIVISFTCTMFIYSGVDLLKSRLSRFQIMVQKEMSKIVFSIFRNFLIMLLFAIVLSFCSL